MVNRLSARHWTTRTPGRISGKTSKRILIWPTRFWIFSRERSRNERCLNSSMRDVPEKFRISPTRDRLPERATESRSCVSLLRLPAQLVCCRHSLPSELLDSPATPLSCRQSSVRPKHTRGPFSKFRSDPSGPFHHRSSEHVGVRLRVRRNPTDRLGRSRRRVAMTIRPWVFANPELAPLCAGSRHRIRPSWEPATPLPERTRSARQRPRLRHRSTTLGEFASPPVRRRATESLVAPELPQQNVPRYGFNVIDTSK